MSLHCLDLSGYDVNTLPEEMKVLALAERKITGNSLSEFPIGLCYRKVICYIILAFKAIVYSSLSYSHLKFY